MTPPEAGDPAGWTLTRLADHLKATDHRRLTELAPRAAALARRIRDVHGAQHPELAGVAAACDDLAAALADHLRREEDAFFPAVQHTEKALKHGEPPAPGDAKTVAESAPALGGEHARLVAALDRLRGLTMDYARPYDACATWDLACSTLRDLDAALREHLRLEDDLLLPRALRLVRAAG